MIKDCYANKYPKYLWSNRRISVCDICGPNAGVVRVLRAPTELTRNAILAAVKLLCSGVVLEWSRAASQPPSTGQSCRLHNAAFSFLSDINQLYDTY